MSILNAAMYRKYLKDPKVRHLVSLFAIILSGFLQAFTLKVFIQPSNLLSSGFLTLEYLSLNFPIFCSFYFFKNLLFFAIFFIKSCSLYLINCIISLFSVFFYFIFFKYIDWIMHFGKFFWYFLLIFFVFLFSYSL